jgi:hypothetical protein
VTFNSAGKTETVIGLTSGITYTFTVTALSVGGPGTASSPSPPVTVGAPSAPKVPSARVRSGQLTLSWRTPSDGGSAIMEYVVTPYMNGVAQSPITFGSGAVSQVITGLTIGTSYTFTVAAVNANATGAASPQSLAIAFP